MSEEVKVLEKIIREADFYAETNANAGLAHYLAKNWWRIRAALAAQSAAPVGICTQAELDAFEGLDSKSKILFSMWVERALKAEATIDAAPAPSAAQWQPIETAPRDGEFLVYLPEEHRKYQVMYRTERTSIIGGAFAFDMSKPTDWMPLPAPPAHPGEQKPPSQTYATFGSDRVSMRSEKV